MVRDRLGRLLQRATAPFLRRVLFSGRRWVVAGFEVYADSSITDADRMIEILESAIVTIKERSPRHFRLVQGSIQTLALQEGHGSGYSPDLRTCVIDVRSARLGDPGALALILVHEAMHGRLFRAGVPNTAANRNRIEAACARVELDLAERLAFPPDFLARLREAACAPVPEPQRMREWRSSIVVDHRMPHWFAWLVTGPLGWLVGKSWPSQNLRRRPEADEHATSTTRSQH